MTCGETSLEIYRHKIRFNSKHIHLIYGFILFIFNTLVYDLLKQYAKAQRKLAMKNGKMFTIFYFITLCCCC